MNNLEHTKKQPHPITKALAVIIGFIAVWYFLNIGIQTQSVQTMEHIQDKVSSDFVDQYNIAKQQGDKIQICVQAGLVAAGFLQAKDAPNYQKWKDIEKADCAKAGLPR